MNAIFWTVIIGGFFMLMIMATVIWCMDRNQQTRCMRKMCKMRENQTGSIDFWFNTFLFTSLLLAIGVTTMAIIFWGAIK